MTEIPFESAVDRMRNQSSVEKCSGSVNWPGEFEMKGSKPKL